MATSSTTRPDKVRRIFDRFDANGDGGLDRSEIAALIAAVNPRVQFTPDQVDAIGDEVFRSYADFIPDPSVGLTLLGLLQTYDDGAGDVDRDFSALFNHSPTPPAAGTDKLRDPKPDPTSPITIIPPRWALSPNHGITHDATWKLLEDLEILIRTRIRATVSKRKVRDSSTFVDMFSDGIWSTDLNVELDGKSASREETNSVEFRIFLKELNELRARVHQAPTREEAFDGHVAIGRTLYDSNLFKQALESFQLALELNPSDAQPQYWLGNTLCSLGQTREAKERYLVALKSAESDSLRRSSLLPQIHVNLGILMEGEGLLVNASEHYKEAAIFCPTHYRALKLLGSAQFGLGEYGSAVKSLEEAVLLDPDYADAHCDLGSALHAMGEEERAVLAFQQAIDLKHDHSEAWYNLGSLFNDVGRYHRAAEIYGRVTAARPDHWRAQLNWAVSLLGSGENEEAKIALNEAFKVSSRVELYDATIHLKQLQRKPREDGVDWLVVGEASKFRCANQKTTGREDLSDALYIRAIQKATKLGCCNVTLLIKEMESTEVLAVSSHSSTSNTPLRSTRKATLEIILRKVLHFLEPKTFQGAVKAINEKIWAVLDVTGSGRLDLGMFFAVIAPICAGPLEKRKRAAFDALLWRSSNTEGQGHVDKADVSMYMRYFTAIYFPTRSFSDLMKASGGREDGARISYREFIGILDGMGRGFAILSTVVKLEAGDRSRHCFRTCAVCRYPVVGLAFRETSSGFRLCANCYSEGRVPFAFQQDEYKFKEYRR